jgi:hypothetical protein
MDRSARRVLGAAALLGAALWMAPLAEASDNCIQTPVTGDFISPDGKSHGAGMVRICEYWEISPSLRLSRILFNGRTLGVWMNRAGEAGRFDERGNTISLRQLENGRVALANYYWPGPDGRPSAPGLRASLAHGSRTALANTPDGFIEDRR